MTLQSLILAIESRDDLSEEEKRKFIEVIKAAMPERDWNKMKDRWLSGKLSKGTHNPEKTVRNNRNYLKHFENFWKEIYSTDTPDMNMIDYDTAIKYLFWLKQQKKRNGQAYDINYISRVYSALVSFLRYSELPGVERMAELTPHKTKKALRYYDARTIKVFWNIYSKRGFFNFMKRINLRLKIATGARNFEIDNLSWDDVDFERGVIRVIMKGGNQVWKYVPEYLIRELTEYHEAYEKHMSYREEQGLRSTFPDGRKRLFFINAKTGLRPPSDSYFASELKKAVKRYNESVPPSERIEHYGMHAIRKFFVNVVRLGGGDLTIAQVLADHKRSETTAESYYDVEKVKKEYYLKYVDKEMRKILKGGGDGEE